MKEEIKEQFRVITTPHVRRFAYLISNKGRIYSMLSGKFLSCYIDKVRPDITILYDYSSDKLVKDPERAQIIEFLDSGYTIKQIMQYYGYAKKSENLNLSNKIK